MGIELHPDQLQRGQYKKQFIEISLKSLVQIWVSFPLPTIIVITIIRLGTGITAYNSEMPLDFPLAYRIG